MILNTIDITHYLFFIFWSSDILTLSFCSTTGRSPAANSGRLGWVRTASSPNCSIQPISMPKGYSSCADCIFINQTKMQEASEIKFLGIIINNELKWSAHISYISKKISKGIGIILSRQVFSNKTLLSLYHTFVYPYLSYCIHVWIQAYKTNLKVMIS